MCGIIRSFVRTLQLLWKDFAVAQEDTYRNLTAETQVRSQASAIDIYDAQSVLGNAFRPPLQFPLSVSFHQCSILIHSSASPDGHTGDA